MHLVMNWLAKVDRDFVAAGNRHLVANFLLYIIASNIHWVYPKSLLDNHTGFLKRRQFLIIDIA